MTRRWLGLGSAVAASLAMALLAGPAEASKAGKACNPRKQRCPPSYTMQNAYDACRQGNHSAVVAVLGGGKQPADYNPYDIEALYCLGVAYLDGVDYRGKPYYRTKAMEALKHPAEKDFRDAKARLKEASSEMRVDLNDPAQAAPHYTALAEKGCTNAMLDLADLYGKGRGVVKSEEVKRRLIHQAMLLGDRAALDRVVKMYEQQAPGSGGQSREHGVMLYMLQNLRTALAPDASAQALILERDAAAGKLSPRERDRAERLAFVAWQALHPFQAVKCSAR